MILVDSNVLMYAAGSEHPHKAPSVRFLEAVAKGDVHAVIDAETLQELLHRYRALGRWKEGRVAYDLVRRIFPMVLPVTAEILDHARGLMDEYEHLMARDALHAAVVRVHSLEALCSYDCDFDRIRNFHRIEPA